MEAGEIQLRKIIIHKTSQMTDVLNMTKKYGKLKANDNITLSVDRGELAVLPGPNSAGKSTLIMSVCGLLRFEGGVTIGEYENHTVEAKRLLGMSRNFPSCIQCLQYRSTLNHCESLPAEMVIIKKQLTRAGEIK